RRGRAILAPMPCNTVRRETCFLKIFIVVSPLDFLSASLLLTRLLTRRRRPLRSWLSRLRRATFTKLLALNYRLNDCRELVIVLGGVPHNPPHGRHIVVLRDASSGIRQKSFGEGLCELIGLAQQRVAQIVGALEGGSVWQFA